MSQRRKDRTNNPPAAQPAAAAPTPVIEDGKKPEAAPDAKPSRTPLFWKIFGGAAVLAVAVVGVAVYQQMQNQVKAQRRELNSLNNHLRHDLAHVSGSYAEMIKKEDHATRLRGVWDTLGALRADRSDLVMLKERCAQMMESYKTAEEDRRALAAEVRKLRETKTAGEERDALARELRALRERIAQLESGRAAKVITAGHAEER